MNLDSLAKYRAAAACSYPVRAGNAVRPLVDGLPAFRAIGDAVEAAERSVWVTVAFLDEDLALPDGRGSFFDLLERAARRGLDVRVLFWSEPEIETMLEGSAHFPAGERSHARLRQAAPHLLARWDRLRGYCHHQKSWLVDAGTRGEVAFVGGINLDHDSVVSPGHPIGEARVGASIHDVYVELRGPAASDVHHNFVQRWNQASEREEPFGVFPDLVAAADLAFPRQSSAVCGSLTVQVARTVRGGVYRGGEAAPGAAPFAVEDGEFSILEQYLAAVDAAERTIYLENQILLCPELFAHLDAALARGVEVMALVPARAMPEIAAARRHPKARPVFEMLESLARHENFLLAALGASAADGRLHDIYVHAKVAVIDDEWATVGSANAMLRSFRGDTEMNVTLWDSAFARELRRELMAEHLGEASEGSDVAAFARYRSRAIDNRGRLDRGLGLIGNVYAIDPREWAVG